MARPQAPRGQGRARVINAALELFAEHGVGATSLQMIADHLGVTKAAVYYQFHAKEEIVVAVVESAFTDMEGFLDEAESASSPHEATGIAMRGLVDLIIAHRQVMATLFRDPATARIVESHQQFQTLASRLSQLLLGPAPDTRRRVATSLLGAGLAQVGMDPELADIDDAALREEMLHLGHALSAAAPTTAMA